MNRINPPELREDKAPELTEAQQIQAHIDLHRDLVKAAMVDYVAHGGLMLEVMTSINNLESNMNGMDFTRQKVSTDDAIYVLQNADLTAEQCGEITDLLDRTPFEAPDGFALVKCDSLAKRMLLEEFVNTHLTPYYLEQGDNVYPMGL